MIPRRAPGRLLPRAVPCLRYGRWGEEPRRQAALGRQEASCAVALLEGEVPGFPGHRRAEGGHYLALSKPAGPPPDLDAKKRGSLLRPEDQRHLVQVERQAFRWATRGSGLAPAGQTLDRRAPEEVLPSRPTVGLQVLHEAARRRVVRRVV